MEELRGGFHAVGFSQGGQFMRALVERCDGLNVHTLVTMGAQHQGVINTPGCRWAGNQLIWQSTGNYQPLHRPNLTYPA